MNDSNIKKSSFFRKLFEKKEADSMPSEGTKLSLEQEKQSLKEENERLRLQLKWVDSILNFAPFPIWMRDENLKVKYCNNAYGDIADMTSEMLLQDAFIELAVGVKDVAKEAFNSGEPATGKVHIIQNGDRRLYKITEVPLISSGQIVGFATDITDQEKAEEEIRLHINAQADLLESSASAMAIYGADTRLRFYNNAFTRLWQLDEEFLDNMPTYGTVLEQLREQRKLPEQANFQVFKKEHLKLFTNLIKPHDEFLYIPDGTVLRMIVIPHALGGLMFAYEDVTDRLALERSYNTLIAVQRATLDNLNEAVAVIGEDARVKLCNPAYCELWELSAEFLGTQPHLSDVVEKTRHLHVYDGEWSEYKQKMISSTLKRESKGITMERRDGRVLRVNLTPLPDGAELVTYYDITDSTVVERSLREKNKALEDADRLKSEFLANVSYELRSPLTSIKGFTEILGAGMLGVMPDKQKEYIGYIDKASNQLMALINDILDIVSIEAGYLKLERKKIDVGALISDIVKSAEDRAVAAKIGINIECNQAVSILADELRIKQAISNLISNSLKFTPAGGAITVGVMPCIGEIEVWVQDTGVGIPEKDKGVVTDKFYKGGSSRAHKSGTGLGLTLARNFIELHGGNLKIESQEGHGTKVSCFIPMGDLS